MLLDIFYKINRKSHQSSVSSFTSCQNEKANQALQIMDAFSSMHYQWVTQVPSNIAKWAKLTEWSTTEMKKWLLHEPTEPRATGDCQIIQSHLLHHTGQGTSPQSSFLRQSGCLKPNNSVSKTHLKLSSHKRVEDILEDKCTIHLSHFLPSM